VVIVIVIVIVIIKVVIVIASKIYYNHSVYLYSVSIIIIFEYALCMYSCLTQRLLGQFASFSPINLPNKCVTIIEKEKFKGAVNLNFLNVTKN